MTTAEAIAILDAEIAYVLREHTAAANGGTVAVHVLDAVTDAEKLAALDSALVWVAMNGRPRGLIGSTGTKLYDVDATTWLRKPATPTNTGDDFDMDEGLVRATIYSAMSRLCSSCDKYEQMATKGIKAYEAAYKIYDKNTA